FLLGTASRQSCPLQLADNPARINRFAAPSHVLYRINSIPINAGQLIYRMEAT
ncbi:hypothetical protein A2U01_0065094, partial [Trifolium medium]|nr:hypothetical protein [Trifolium medium]